MKNALAIALASCLPSASWAASPPPLPPGLLACSKIADAGERVRCYDAQIAAITGATNRSAPAAAPSVAAATGPAAISSPATAAPTPAAPVASRSAPAPARIAPGESSTSHFGEELLPPSERPPEHRKVEALVSSITAIHKVRPTVVNIVLANGQIWRQEDGNEITALFRAGDEVRIERRPLGAYHLSSPRLGTKNWVDVRRIR